MLLVAENKWKRWVYDHGSFWLLQRQILLILDQCAFKVQTCQKLGSERNENSIWISRNFQNTFEFDKRMNVGDYTYNVMSAILESTHTCVYISFVLLHQNKEIRTNPM